MLGESKHNISGDVAGLLVREVNGRIDLKKIIRCPGCSESEKVLSSALEIDLQAVLFVEVVGVTQNGFDALMNRLYPRDQLVVLGVITPSQIGLRRLTIGRPIHEASAK